MKTNGNDDTETLVDVPIHNNEAPTKYFNLPDPPPENKFEVGNFLRVQDPKNNDLFVFATVVQKTELWIKYQVYGLDNSNVKWVSTEDNSIRPLNADDKDGKIFGCFAPLGTTSFNIHKKKLLKLIEKNKNMIAPEHFFESRQCLLKPQKNLFRAGHKLLARDLKNSGNYQCLYEAIVTKSEGDNIQIKYEAGKESAWFKFDSRDIFSYSYARKFKLTVGVVVRTDKCKVTKSSSSIVMVKSPGATSQPVIASSSAAVKPIVAIPNTGSTARSKRSNSRAIRELEKANGTESRVSELLANAVKEQHRRDATLVKTNRHKPDQLNREVAPAESAATLVTRTSSKRLHVDLGRQQLNPTHRTKSQTTVRQIKTEVGAEVHNEAATINRSSSQNTPTNVAEPPAPIVTAVNEQATELQIKTEVNAKTEVAEMRISQQNVQRVQESGNSNPIVSMITQKKQAQERSKPTEAMSITSNTGVEIKNIVIGYRQAAPVTRVNFVPDTSRNSAMPIKQTLETQVTSSIARGVVAQHLNVRNALTHPSSNRHLEITQTARKTSLQTPFKRSFKTVERSQLTVANEAPAEPNSKRIRNDATREAMSCGPAIAPATSSSSRIAHQVIVQNLLQRSPEAKEITHRVINDSNIISMTKASPSSSQNFLNKLQLQRRPGSENYQGPNPNDQGYLIYNFGVDFPTTAPVAPLAQISTYGTLVEQELNGTETNQEPVGEFVIKENQESIGNEQEPANARGNVIAEAVDIGIAQLMKPAQIIRQTALEICRDHILYFDQLAAKYRFFQMPNAPGIVDYQVAPVIYESIIVSDKKYIKRVEQCRRELEPKYWNAYIPEDIPLGITTPLYDLPKTRNFWNISFNTTSIGTLLNGEKVKAVSESEFSVDLARNVYDKLVKALFECRNTEAENTDWRNNLYLSDVERERIFMKPKSPASLYLSLKTALVLMGAPRNLVVLDKNMESNENIEDWEKLFFNEHRLELLLLTSFSVALTRIEVIAEVFDTAIGRRYGDIIRLHNIDYPLLIQMDRNTILEVFDVTIDEANGMALVARKIRAAHWGTAILDIKKLRDRDRQQ